MAGKLAALTCKHLATSSLYRGTFKAVTGSARSQVISLCSANPREAVTDGPEVCVTLGIEQETGNFPARHMDGGNYLVK